MMVNLSIQSFYIVNVPMLEFTELLYFTYIHKRKHIVRAAHWHVMNTLAAQKAHMHYVHNVSAPYNFNLFCIYRWGRECCEWIAHTIFWNVCCLSAACEICGLYPTKSIAWNGTLDSLRESTVRLTAHGAQYTTQHYCLCLRRVQSRAIIVQCIFFSSSSFSHR